MDALTEITQTHLSPADVDTMTRSWPDLLSRPMKSKAERDQMDLTIQTIMTPATPRGIAAKLVPMMTEYFVAMDRGAVAKQVADIWQAELAPYPLWAIHNATRWWLSRHNDLRRKKTRPRRHWRIVRGRGFARSYGHGQSQGVRRRANRRTLAERDAG